MDGRLLSRQQIFLLQQGIARWSQRVSITFCTIFSKGTVLLQLPPLTLGTIVVGALFRSIYSLITSFRAARWNTHTNKQRCAHVEQIILQQVQSICGWVLIGLDLAGLSSSFSAHWRMTLYIHLINRVICISICMAPDAVS